MWNVQNRSRLELPVDTVTPVDGQSASNATRLTLIQIAQKGFSMTETDDVLRGVRGFVSFVLMVVAVIFGPFDYWTRLLIVSLFLLLW